MSFEQSPRQSEKYLGKYTVDAEGFVALGDIARGELHRQCQYVSSFVDGLDRDTPNLGEGLKFASIRDKRTGEVTGNYHEYRIHVDDIMEFVQRVKRYYDEQ